ncbi:MAG: metal ABC transporter substrate-binding protein [Eubacteriales bacterium]|nr:metal ABC transporter substrate-binding protein [Eubacteriales bacterium]
MKKIWLVSLIAVFLFTVTGCKKADIPGKEDGKIDIVCTTFPQYDWTRNLIAGVENQYNITLILNQGTDMHSYQPSAEDIIKITECDLLIYGGGESEHWVKDALKKPKNPDLMTICLMDTLGDSVKEEVLIEGMQAEQDADEHEESDVESDEHVWLSVKNAKVFVEAIADTLILLDSDNKQTYENNSANYKNQLDELDKQFEDAVMDAKHDTVVFADRFSFLYMMEDYGLNYYAAFPGCSAETEASFDTIMYLAGKIDENDLSCVMVLENSDHKLADTIVSNTKTRNQTIVEMYSMQSITNSMLDTMSYISFMQQNIEALKTVLN